jgi:hypothetical protein
MSQAEIQGVFDERVEHLNEYRTGMADIALEFNALSQVVHITFMTKETDIYGDTTDAVESELDKLAVVTKNPDMSYVQDLFGYLGEDREDEIPWLVKLTLTDMPRIIRHDDRILIGEIEFSVSKVTPINRLNDGLLKVLVYPERGDIEVNNDESCDCDCDSDECDITDDDN